MKVLNIYLTKIYSYMDSSGYFNLKRKNGFDSDGHKKFIQFAGDLGYPEFGLLEGMRLGDFSYLPNSDLINFNDLNPSILKNLPEDVAVFIKKEIPDLYHQIYLTLALKDYTNKNLSFFLNSFTNYVNFLRHDKKRKPIQRDYDFLNYVIDLVSRPTYFSYLLDKIAEDEDKLIFQWKTLLTELVLLSSGFDKCKKFTAQIITSTTKYNYSDLLRSTILSQNWKGYLSDKLLKSIDNKSSSFIEIGSNCTFFSVKTDDLNNVAVLDKITLLIPRLRVIFPEIYYFNIDEDTFFQRRVLILNYASLIDMKKKAFNTFFSSIINPLNDIVSVDKFNENILNSLYSVIAISEVLDKGNVVENEDEDIDKI